MVTEIIIYQLKVGQNQVYWNAFINQSLPLMKEWGIDVVNYGFSLENPLIFHLVRTFESLEHRNQLLDKFYASQDWQQGARSDILNSISASQTTLY